MNRLVQFSLYAHGVDVVTITILQVGCSGKEGFSHLIQVGHHLSEEFGIQSQTVAQPMTRSQSDFAHPHLTFLSGMLLLT